jgi:hypothetical protein
MPTLISGEIFPICCELETKQEATHRKTDVFKRQMWYSIDTEKGEVLSCLSVQQVNEIIEMNKKGIIPDKLLGIEESSMASVIEYQNAAGLESLTRFEDAPDISKTPKLSKKKRFKP